MIGESDKRATNGSAPWQPGEFDWRLLLWVLAVVVLTFYFTDRAQNVQTEQLTYTAFKQAVRQGRVPSVTLQGQEIRGQFAQGEAAEGGQATAFVSTRPPVDDPALISLLEDNAVTIKALSTRAEWWQRLLINLLPWVLIFGVLIYFGHRMQQRMSGQGGLFNFARSQARRLRA